MTTISPQRQLVSRKRRRSPLSGSRDRARRARAPKAENFGAIVRRFATACRKEEALDRFQVGEKSALFPLWDSSTPTPHTADFVGAARAQTKLIFIPQKVFSRICCGMKANPAFVLWACFRLSLVATADNSEEPEIRTLLMAREVTVDGCDPETLGFVIDKNRLQKEDY